VTGPTPSTHGRVWRTHRFVDRHPVVPGLGIAVGYAVIMSYSRVAFGHEVSVDRILASLVVGASGGIVLTFVLLRRRRATSSRFRWIDVSEAIDDGRLPADSEDDADAWRYLLLRRREVHDQLGGPWAVLVAAMLLGGTVAVAVLGGPPLAWTLPAVIAVAVAVMAVIRRRRLVRIDALLQPLLDADAAAAPERRPPT
jgi:hypothetical protein